MHLKEVDVWITCDGVAPLPEYGTRLEEDGQTVSCFVPSEAGKSFVVCWRNTLDEHFLIFKVRLDGTPAGSSLVPHGQDGSRWGVRTSADVRQPYQFAELVLTDADEAAEQYGAPELGTIQVSVRRVEATYMEHARPIPPSRFQAPGPVHERSKKAGAHCVQLGEGQRVQETQTNWETTILDEAWKRRFVFHYKPLALLQAQGLAPMGPPPPLAGLKPEPEPAPAPAPAALAPKPALGQVPLAPAPGPAPGLVPTPGSAHARALWPEPQSQPVPVLAPTHVRLAEEARRARGELDGDGRKRELGRERDGESPPKRQRLAPAPSPNSAPSLVEVKPRVVDFSRGGGLAGVQRGPGPSRRGAPLRYTRDEEGVIDLTLDD